VEEMCGRRGDDGSFGSWWTYDVHVFIEFRASRWFADGVANIQCCGDVREKDEFFFCPLKDAEVTHADVACLS
jgi:hypothetical protein